MVTSYSAIPVYELWDKLQLSRVEAHTAVKDRIAVKYECSWWGMDADAYNSSTHSDCCGGIETLHWF